MSNVFCEGWHLSISVLVIWLSISKQKSRDVILTILKVLAGQGRVIEMSNAFEIVSIPRLVIKKLVLIAEIKNLKDKTSLQLKETIEKTTPFSKCQLVFHGSEDPGNCGSFYDISGDKIIPLQFNHATHVRIRSKITQTS